MKILYILSRFPYPLEKGDKLRAYNQVKNLSERHEVILFALSDKKVKDEDIAHLEKFCSTIKVFHLSRLSLGLNLLKALFTGLPFQVEYFYSSKAQHILDGLVTEYKPDHIFCQLIRTAPYAKKYASIPKTLDYMDVFSKGIERRFNTTPFYLKPLYKNEYKRLVRYEQEVFGLFKNKLIISKQDRELLPHPGKDKVHIISNGVDTDYYTPGSQQKEFDILFNGNMHYPSNIESAEYLVKKILPLVQSKYPGIKVMISGANPTTRVLALQSENVKVSGWVNDVRDNFRKSKMLVAPMFLSIGLQNKLLEAMAMQVPCITSPLANNALGAENGKEILVANTPEEYATNILALLADANKAATIGMNGYHFVLEHFSWTKETEKLEKIITAG